MVMDLKEKARRCREFLDALDEERRKILVFHRELPLSLNLIDQTIDNYKKMVDVLTTSDHEEPVLQEFISLKPSSAISEDQSINNDQQKLEKYKNDWDLPKNPIDNVDSHHSSKEKEAAASSQSASESSQNGGSDGEEEEKSQNPRKTRRCWSEDLHRRFVDAIDQLGGCHAATPKQIREIMKVDGLTNDEVKSHLQKFRIHTKRTSSVIQSQSTQFLVGIWIPASDYATQGCDARNVSANGRMYGFDA